MNMDNATFYREHCNVVKYWAAATAIGLLFPGVAFMIAIFGWLKCQRLWTANERGDNIVLRNSRISWIWLT
jgi:hypothetical protein